VYRHRSVSLNNEKICCEISEDKIAFCEKTSGLRSGNVSDLNSACSKVLVPVKIFALFKVTTHGLISQQKKSHLKSQQKLQV
jgi:hypothetical protein